MTPDNQPALLQIVADAFTKYFDVSGIIELDIQDEDQVQPLLRYMAIGIEDGLEAESLRRAEGATLGEGREAPFAYIRLNVNGDVIAAAKGTPGSFPVYTGPKSEWPECSGDPMCCPENEGFGCCKAAGNTMRECDHENGYCRLNSTPAPQRVPAAEYDRELVARMLEAARNGSLHKFSVESVERQCALLRAADNAEAAGVHTAQRVAAGDDGLAEFTEYFVRNYHGPDTIISDPKWHAPRIFRAAQRAIAPPPTGEAVAWVTSCEAGIMTAEVEPRMCLPIGTQLYTAAQAEGRVSPLIEALESIRQYGADTLSGRADGGVDDRKWQRDAVLEMTRRARIALETARAALTAPADVGGESK